MGKGLAFFYRRKQLSGEIRRQVAEVLGAKVNPLNGVEQDICIGVKMSPYLVRKDKRIPGWADFYLDFIDHSTVLRWLERWPSVKLIMASRCGEAYVHQRLRNPTWFIPQHHCNIEGWHRPVDRPVRVVGFVGALPVIPWWKDVIERGVTRMGLEMRWVTQYEDRQDVVAAYKDIDIQFVWREGMTDWLLHTKNPLKIINAAAFGIPTVANTEPAYEMECQGRYYACSTIEDALGQLAELRSAAGTSVYTDGSLIQMAEPYHIDRIASAFRRLADG